MYLIKEIMNKELVSVDVSATLLQILKIFYKYKFRIIPVLDDKKKLVGIIEWENIFQIFKPYPKHIENFVQHLTGVPKEFREIFNIDLSFEMPHEIMVLFIATDLMDTNFVTANEEEKFSIAYKKMKESKVNALFIINKENKLVGMLTLLDIVLGILKKKGFL